jgi:hypothetical protein
LIKQHLDFTFSSKFFPGTTQAVANTTQEKTSKNETNLFGHGRYGEMFRIVPVIIWLLPLHLE